MRKCSYTSSLTFGTATDLLITRHRATAVVVEIIFGAIKFGFELVYGRTEKRIELGSRQVKVHLTTALKSRLRILRTLACLKSLGGNYPL